LARPPALARLRPFRYDDAMMNGRPNRLLHGTRMAFAVGAVTLIAVPMVQPLAATIAASLPDGTARVILVAEAPHRGGPAVMTAGGLEISAYWARAMLPGQPTGGGYLSVTNKGEAADRLLSVSSPAAGMVEIHTMEVVNDVMNMRPVEGGLEIPVGATVALQPGGGMHLMFMQVKVPFAQGGTVPITLEFEKAGKVDIALPVEKAGAE
jgi:copper(I)-binding protein